MTKQELSLCPQKQKLEQALFREHADAKAKVAQLTRLLDTQTSTSVDLARLYDPINAHSQDTEIKLRKVKVSQVLVLFVTVRPPP